MRRNRFVATVTIGLVFGLVATACGGGDKSKSSSSNSTSGSKTTASPNAGKAPTAVPGFDGTTITLGVITPQTGAQGAIAGKYLGAPLTDGNQMYWDDINAKGGVAGKYKVKLVVKDSQYDATVGSTAYTSLKDNVLAFQQVLGTAVLQAIQPSLNTDNTIAGPATLDADWNLDEHLFPFTTSYQLLAINAIDYYLKNGGAGKNVCVLSQDDGYGAAGTQGAEYVAKADKITIKSTQKVTLLGDKTAAIQALKSANCDMVFTTLLFIDMKSVVKTAQQLSFTPRFILMAPAWERSFTDKTDAGYDASFADYLQKNMWVSATGPQWGDTTNPGMVKLLSVVKQYRPQQKANLYFEFGYAQAWALDQILAIAAKNGDFSHAGLLTAMNQVGTLKFDNLLPDYKYGTSVDQRVTPLPATIFSVDGTIDGGLKTLAADYVSDAAKTYKFTK